MHNKRIMVLIENIWRIAKITSETFNSATADLNGMTIALKHGEWFYISDSMSDDQLLDHIIQSNISHLFSISDKKANIQRLQGRVARLFDLTNQVQQETIQPQPQPANQLIGNDAIIVDDVFDEMFDDDGCSCEDCCRARSEV